MRLKALLTIASTLAFPAGLAAYSKYRRELNQRVQSVETGGLIADTAAGPIEYAEAGEGQPLLLIHGAGGGYDQGLLVARDFGPGYRVIAPSRFGYLGTPIPDDPSIAAQAAAHLALLDHLNIHRCIVAGVSAGAPSAVELALRHPDRVSALILLVPRTYDPSQAIGPDKGLQSQAVLRVVETSADFLFWLAIKLARASVVRFLGVPPELEAAASPEERARVTEVMRSILPLSRRAGGLLVDGNARIDPWPLDQICTPTLIVSAQDDLYNTLPGARFTASGVPGAELKILESGGHLMVGQAEQVQAWVSDFLHRVSDHDLLRSAA